MGEASGNGGNTVSEETTNNYLYKKRVQLLAFNMAHLRTLGLKDSHISLIVAVESFRQNKNELPYPSNEKVAERMGVSTITIKRRTRELRELKLLQRPKGGIKPIWNFASLYELLENRKKESLNRLNGVTKYQSLNGDKKVSNSSKNKPLTGSMDDTLKVKIKEKNKPSSKVTLRDNLTIEPGINFEKESNINFNPPLKSKRSKTTLREKTLIQEFSDYYDNLPPENTIERLTEVLADKVIDQILVLKEGEIRSQCKVFYHRINQQALTTLTLEDFPYEDVPEGSKRRKFLVLTISKRAWRVVSSCLKGEAPFPLIASKSGRRKNTVSENVNGSGYVGDPPREEAKRILRSLQNSSGNGRSSHPKKTRKKPISSSAPNWKLSLGAIDQFYGSLSDKKDVLQLAKILTYKAIELFLTAKEPGCHKINLDTVTDRVLKDFPFQDVPLLEPKRGSYLILNTCKIVSRILTNTGNEDTSLEITEPAQSEIGYRHNGNGADTNGNGVGDKAQDKRNQDKGKPLKHSLGKSSPSKPSDGDGYKGVSHAKLLEALDGLPWYQKFKERSLTNN